MTAEPSGWLAVQAAAQHLLLPLTQCGEIHTSATVQRLPRTQPWLLGVANLRGQIATVVDLGAYLGLPAAPLAADGVCGPLVALPPALGVPAALRLGALKGMRQAAAMQPDDHAAPPPWAAGAWLDEQGQRWLALDLALMTRQLRFIDVAA